MPSRIGHRLALAVEDARIALTAEETTTVPLPFLEADLAATATCEDLDRAIETMTDRLSRTAGTCLAAAGLGPADIDTVFLTGGSSRVPAVGAAIGRAAPSARLTGGTDDLLSIPLGLTEMAARMT